MSKRIYCKCCNCLYLEEDMSKNDKDMCCSCWCYTRPMEIKIQNLEHRLSNCIEPKFKQSQAVFIIFENDYLKGYVDCFDFYTKKYLVHYPDEVLGDDWCSENEIFASKAEVEAKLEELKNGKV